MLYNYQNMSDSVNATSNYVSQYYSKTERVVGRVKWFNSKTGFGFISTLGDSPKDIFVHHSELQVKDEQYRYLFQGEFVEFLIGAPQDGSEYEVIAKDVTGLFRELLMCETKRIARIASASKMDVDTDSGFQQVRPRKSRGGGPRQLRQSKGSSSPSKKSTTEQHVPASSQSDN